MQTFARFICSTCFFLLVAAAPSVSFVNAWMVAAHGVGVVTACFPQSREPLIQFVYALKRKTFREPYLR